MRIFPLAVVSVLALSACKGETAPQASESSASPVAAASAAAVPQAACAPVKLDLSPARFTSGRVNFAEGKLGRTKLDDNFAKAYDAACAAGWFAKKPLIDPRAAKQDVLFVANAPNANEASIYFDADGAGREMVIEGPFISPGGHVQVPGAKAIQEAIYCYAVGATEQEQEASGRCLVD